MFSVASILEDPSSHNNGPTIPFANANFYSGRHRTRYIRGRSVAVDYILDAIVRAPSQCQMQLFATEEQRLNLTAYFGRLTTLNPSNITYIHLADSPWKYDLPQFDLWFD